MKVSLSCSVNVLKGEKGYVSKVMIKANAHIFAVGTLVGKYNEVQALREFTKTQRNFKLAPTFSHLTSEQIKALAV